MSEWQPIETAPKDGTRVLLYTENDAAEVIGYWTRPEDRGYDANKDASWWNVYRGIGFLRPTHWMPLPDPPK